jgi:hypothetical protein
LLQATGSVGKAFNLCCPCHTETELKVYQPKGFERISPEGGCQLPCQRKLNDCGHRYQARCHSKSMHQVFYAQPCERFYSPYNHSCQKATCGEDCGFCRVKLDNIRLPCGYLTDGVMCCETRRPVQNQMHCHDSDECSRMQSLGGCEMLS